MEHQGQMSYFYADAILRARTRVCSLLNFGSDLSVGWAAESPQICLLYVLLLLDRRIIVDFACAR